MQLARFVLRLWLALRSPAPDAFALLRGRLGVVLVLVLGRGGGSKYTY